MPVRVGRQFESGNASSKLLATTGKVAAGFAAYEGAVSLWRQVAQHYKDNVVRSIVVDETDYLYPDVQEWLLNAVPSQSQKSLLATTISKRDAKNFYDSIGDHGDSYPDPSRAGVKLSLNDKHPQKIQIDGHAVRVQVLPVSDVIAQGVGGTSAGTVTSSASTKIPMCVQFTTRTEAGQKAIVKLLEGLQRDQKSRAPVLRLINQWGSWSTRSDLPLRDLDSVVLPQPQKDRIVNDIQAFLEAEDKYLELALPWHRGFMLHGPPGTGKSSLVKAVANEFDLDLWCLSLSDLEKDASLTGLIGEVRPGSILLLEDIDTIRITKDRAKAKKDGDDDDDLGPSISLSSLLNALDGVATPHGLITFMTTNHFEKLDPALTRAGRMDRIERLEHPTAALLDALFVRFYGKQVPTPSFETGSQTLPFSQAEASEVFKRHLEDPTGARESIRQLKWRKDSEAAEARRQ